MAKKSTTKKKTKRATKKRAAKAAALPDSLMTPPKAVQAALKRGLKLKPEYGGKGLVPTTITWARKLAKGEPITPEKAKKMAAYFARHGVDQKPDWDDPPTPGYVAWLLWGGDAGKRWSERIVKKLDAAES